MTCFRPCQLACVWVSAVAILPQIGGCDESPRHSPQSQTTETPQQSPASEDPPNDATNARSATAAPTTIVEKLNPALTEHFRLIQSRQTGAARVRLVNYMKIHPDDGQAVFLFGLSYHREKKYAQAIPHFEKALTLTPNYIVIHYFMGWAQYYLGELEAARAAFERFLALKPDEPDANFGVGLIELDEHNLAEAQRRLEKSIAVLRAREPKPGSPDAAALSKAHARLSEVFEERAGAEKERENLELAKSHLRRAIELFPDAYEAMYKLYRVHVRLGETEEASAAQKQYLAAKERVRPGTAFPE